MATNITADVSLNIKKIMSEKNISTDADFARILGISKQNLLGWKKRNSYDINKIVYHFPDINPLWLLTGEGEMLKTNSHSEENKTVAIEERTERNSLKYYYELSATASNIENIEDNELNQPYILINFPGYEGCVGFNVMGDSMYPTARERDIVAIVPEPVSTIANGEVYLLITRDGQRMIKRLRVLEETETEDGAMIRCISDNPDKELYAPFSVHTKDVHNIFRVKGFISSKILA